MWWTWRSKTEIHQSTLRQTCGGRILWSESLVQNWWPCNGRWLVWLWVCHERTSDYGCVTSLCCIWWCPLPWLCQDLVGWQRTRSSVLPPLSRSWRWPWHRLHFCWSWLLHAWGPLLWSQHWKGISRQPLPIFSPHSGSTGSSTCSEHPGPHLWSGQSGYSQMFDV